MACPRCGSNSLWDDNLWWGCNDCGFAAGPDGPSMMFAVAIPGLPDTIDEVNSRAGWTALDYMPRLVRTEPHPEDDGVSYEDDDGDR